MHCTLQVFWIILASFCWLENTHLQLLDKALGKQENRPWSVNYSGGNILTTLFNG
jgi:hypothetical protein